MDIEKYFLSLNPNSVPKSSVKKKDSSKNSMDLYSTIDEASVALSENEIPVFIYELHENASNAIQNEDYEKAIVLLSKCYNILQALKVETSKKDGFLLLLAANNLAHCHQKLGNLEKCAEFLRATLKVAKRVFVGPQNIGEYIQRLRLLARLSMQLCAVLSQQNNHKEACNYAKTAAKFCHLLIKELQKLCKQYAEKIERNKSKNAYEDISATSPISLIDICSLKVLPVLQELLKRMIPPKEREQDIDICHSKLELDMRCMFGYLNLNDWASGLNIGGLMQINVLNINDILNCAHKDTELSREAICEKVALICTAYFCVATEKRFLHQQAQDPTKNNDKISQYQFAEPSKESYFSLRITEK